MTHSPINALIFSTKKIHYVEYIYDRSLKSFFTYPFFVNKMSNECNYASVTTEVHKFDIEQIFSGTEYNKF